MSEYDTTGGGIARCDKCIYPMMARPYEIDQELTDKHGVLIQRYNWECPNCRYIKPGRGVVTHEILRRLVNKALNEMRELGYVADDPRYDHFGRNLRSFYEPEELHRKDEGKAE